VNPDQLRQDLHVLADQAPAPAADLAETVLARRRGLRRQRAGLAGAVLAVTLVVAGVPLALGRPDARPGATADPAAPAADVRGPAGLGPPAPVDRARHRVRPGAARAGPAGRVRR
jgi:hypothetical protein